jgi:hypothetical protein
VKISPDLALGGKRFKEELPDATQAAWIFVWSGRALVGFARLLSFLAIMR